MALTKVGKEGVTGISNSSNATAITINSSENVGIGKSTSIADRVHIEKSGANCLLSVARTSDGAAGRLVMQHTDSVGALQTTGSVPLTLGTADSERIRIDAVGAVKIKSTGGATPTYSHTNNGEGITFRYNDDSGARAADIVAIGNNPAGATMAMRFFINPASTDAAAERMRIASDGGWSVSNVGSHADGRNSNAANKASMHYAGLFLSIASFQDTPMLLNRMGNNGTIISFRQAGNTVGTISVTGSNTAYNTSSDYRLKTNVSYDWDATTRLKQLKPVRFEWIADGDDAVPVDGFLAHEAQTVVPEAVTGTKDAMTDAVLYVDGDEIPDGKKVGDVKTEPQINPQGIDQSKIVPLLCKTILELEARITTLENA